MAGILRWERRIKVYSVIHANEGGHCDMKFSSAVVNDSFMLALIYFRNDEIVVLDRVYINYEKFEELMERAKSSIFSYKILLRGEC